MCLPVQRIEKGYMGKKKKKEKEKHIFYLQFVT